jgi:Probable cobalt transporter subunit (CbtA)
LKTITFIAITLIAGAISGAFLAVMNLGVVEPYIDEAINIENQNAIAQGELLTHKNSMTIDSGKRLEK